ncbi:MAG: SDR family oxidoreductase [Bacteroidetes bacterium]|nr:SDR family oxidoreductase [Bacteroidota bacterium]MBU1372589.1 SDR family oxidoreductase [Bacteroidota bacterium]MBU1484785.1 SDR family oxidoreductase [Bacteroidota bacterium]MBU1759665.1 SDR family oxidoreductase [Bacteroidota bacterium]MBU2047098.1 SDR family oxidoreductase [Bacteroidota bacterium]
MSKTIFITGASSGIGKTTAIYFAERGWNVAATMRKPQEEVELVKYKTIKCYALDVMDEESIEKAFHWAIQDFGAIDVLLNNAGYAALGPFEAADKYQIAKQFDTNVIGLMSVCQQFIPYFRERKSGSIINISSVGGRITFPLYSLYHGTKWAVEGFTESLSFELKPFNIKVKIIEPGAIKTDFYDRSPDLLKKEGLHVYDAYVDKISANFLRAAASAPGPEVVAKIIWRAANSNSFKLRYAVGSGAPFILFLRRILPHAWFMGLVRRVLDRS